nr:uncharacterized protein LOC124812582 [Hydra vulgaris]
MNSTFPILFNSKLIFEDKNVIQLRASIKSEDEANQWVEEYGHKTHTRWLKSYKLNEPTRLVAHRKYQCQHSKLNKEIKSRKNTYCVAEIDIKIKKVNANTKKNDQYLKEEPSLSGVIVVHKNHNHNIECADSMKYLPVSSVTKKHFYNYFNSGLSPAQAKRIHTDNFIYHENGSFLLADASLNPSSRALVTVIEEDLKWSVLVFTEVMQRNQLRKSSSEIVFVDTTSSCDISQTNVTIVSTSSSAGCIPVAILFHANKTEENYEQAFKLLTLECPRCFGGSEEPQVFMLDDSSEE